MGEQCSNPSQLNICQDVNSFSVYANYGNTLQKKWSPQNYHKSNF